MRVSWSKLKWFVIVVTFFNALFLLQIADSLAGFTLETVFAGFTVRTILGILSGVSAYLVWKEI